MVKNLGTSSEIKYLMYGQLHSTTSPSEKSISNLRRHTNEGGSLPLNMNLSLTPNTLLTFILSRCECEKASSGRACQV